MVEQSYLAGITDISYIFDHFIEGYATDSNWNELVSRKNSYNLILLIYFILPSSK